MLYRKRQPSTFYSNVLLDYTQSPYIVELDMDLLFELLYNLYSLVHLYCATIEQQMGILC
jgi:hypothetical protein